MVKRHISYFPIVGLCLNEGVTLPGGFALAGAELFHFLGSKVFEGTFYTGSVKKGKTSEHPLAESAPECLNVLNAQMKDLMRLDGDFEDCLDWQHRLMTDKCGTKLLFSPKRSQSIKKINAKAHRRGVWRQGGGGVCGQRRLSLSANQPSASWMSQEVAGRRAQHQETVTPVISCRNVGVPGSG